MDISEIQPVQNQPVLFFKKSKILVIADLHIGIDGELREQGLNVPFQTEKMFDGLFKLCDKLKPGQIILLGDIKHNIPSAEIKERKDVRNFLSKIEEYGTIHIIPGNHDGFIHKLASSNILIHSSEGFVIDNIGFTHGHRLPSVELMNCDQLVIGHTHPTVMFIDRLSHRSFESCWIKGNFLIDKIKTRYPDTNYPKILIMPAFNPLCGGIAINKDGISGPFGKFIDIENAQIYLIDGSDIGKVKDLNNSR